MSGRAILLEDIVTLGQVALYGEPAASGTLQQWRLEGISGKFSHAPRQMHGKSAHRAWLSTLWEILHLEHKTVAAVQLPDDVVNRASDMERDGTLCTKWRFHDMREATI